MTKPGRGRAVRVWDLSPRSGSAQDRHQYHGPRLRLRRLAVWLDAPNAVPRIAWTKLRMIVSPQVVSIDSGWNWMPSVGWVACRNAIGIRPVAVAVTDR